MPRKIAPIGQLALQLHTEAAIGGAVEPSEESRAFVRGLTDPKGDGIGRELRRGRVTSEDARRVQKAILRRLNSFDLCVRLADAYGYNPILVRSFLSRHYRQMRRADLDSTAYSIFVDLRLAINASTLETRFVALALILGEGPQQIGNMLKTNGSRTVHRAMRELAQRLEGTYGGGVRRVSNVRLPSKAELAQ